MPQIRAATSAEAFWTLDPFGIEVHPGDPWHADLEAALEGSRYGVVTWLTRRLTPTRVRPEFCHLGIVGSKGTGKTTQVRKAMAEVLNYDSVPWWDVHPLARVDRRFDVAWRNLSRIAT